MISFVNPEEYIHTDKSLATTYFFGDTVLEVAERNMRLMEIKYFEFYCKLYYFDEHFELKMVLWTKYLDNSWPRTNQVKMIQKNNEKSLKQMSEKSFSDLLLRVWNHIIPNIY